MLVRFVKKIFFVPVIFLVLAVFDVVTFEYLFELLFNKGNQKIKNFNYEFFVTYFSYTLFEIIMMLGFLFLLIFVTFFIFRKNSWYQKNFLLIGIFLNLIVWSIFIVSFANFYYFDDTLLRVFYILIRAILIGWLTAWFLRPVLYPLKLNEPTIDS
jgi:hypothetical protein